MKAVIQRVKKAEVTVEKKTVGKIEEGFLVLRYTNRQVNEKFSEVCEDIYNHINVRKS